jgi:hypothetical protein
LFLIAGWQNDPAMISSAMMRKQFGNESRDGLAQLGCLAAQIELLRAAIA